MRPEDLDPQVRTNLPKAARFMGRKPSELLAEGEVEYTSLVMQVRFALDSSPGCSSSSPLRSRSSA